MNLSVEDAVGSFSVSALIFAGLAACFRIERYSYLSIAKDKRSESKTYMRYVWYLLMKRHWQVNRSLTRSRHCHKLQDSYRIKIFSSCAKKKKYNLNWFAAKIFISRSKKGIVYFCISEQTITYNMVPWLNLYIKQVMDIYANITEI
jgi:hypothetical protein